MQIFVSLVSFAFLQVVEEEEEEEEEDEDDDLSVLSISIDTDVEEDAEDRSKEFVIRRQRILYYWFKTYCFI